MDDARRYLKRIDSEIERATHRREHMRDLWHNVRYAARRMRTAPVFTIAAIATLALGFGANTAVYSVVEAALLRPLPYPNADRVTALYTQAPFGPFSTSPPDFHDWREQTKSFSEMAAFYPHSRTLTGLGEPQSIGAAMVTQRFFDVLGVAPMLGRAFAPSEAEVGSTNVVVLSHGIWQQMFAGNADVVGRSVQLDGDAFTIIGVMPPGFRYPGRAQLWTPLAFTARTLQTQRGAHYLDVIGLLAPGAPASSAEADLKRVAAGLAAQYPNTNKDYSASLATLRDDLVGDTPRRALLVLLVAVALVALIACANVANLVLARGTARGREFSVRLALGASSRDLLYMSLTESVLLALCGGAAGLLLARGLTGALDALRPESLRQVGDLQIQLSAGAYTFLLALLAGVLFGLAPALQASRRHNLQRGLQSGGRADAGDRRVGSLRSMLVAGEIALAVILLSGAGLLIKSFATLQRVDAGFDAEQTLVFSLALPDARYDSSRRVALAYEDIVGRIAALPGVERAGLMSMLPLDGDRYSISIGSIDGQRIPSTEQPSAQIRIVSPSALETLRIPLAQGRMFEASDRLGSAPVVLVNESAARMLWKDVNPIGHIVRIGTRFTEDTARAGGTVVGIVRDILDRTLGSPPSAIIYFPHAQAPWEDVNVVVRAAPGLEPTSLVGAVRDQVHAVDALLPIVDPRTMDDVVSASVTQPRFATLLMSVFAFLALLLAVIGVAGVMAYVVGQRTREIGIRMALGASQRRVVRETLLSASVPLILGSVVGLAVTVAVVRQLANLLYGVTPRDPAVLGGVTALLLLVALLAAYLPARRASTVDPLIAVRSD
ncbi:MAG: ABC transporter permease, partial [Gemmatimonadaceae bacterium]